MTSAVFACGHWRRRDPLAGLSLRMLDALAAAAPGPLSLAEGVYFGATPADGPHAPATVRALAERGLLRLSAGASGAERLYRLTRAGADILAERRRRAAVRASLRG